MFLLNMSTLIEATLSSQMRTTRGPKRRTRREFLVFSVVMSAVIYAGVGDYRVTRPFDSYSGMIKPLLINGDTTNCIILSGIVDTDDSEEEVKNMLPEGLDSNQRLIYVHVGKTGGTTLAYVLRSNCY